MLAADVSRSIDDEEFDLQRRGYAAAIVSDKLMEAIHSGPHGAIALAYVEWAGEGEQTIVVDWTVLRNVDRRARNSPPRSPLRRAPSSAARRSARRSISPWGFSPKAGSRPTAR